MMQDVDIMAERPEAFATELATYLTERFPHQMAARVPAVRRGERIAGYRVYQQRTAERGGNRHLADVRIFDVPRDALTIENDVQYTGPH